MDTNCELTRDDKEKGVINCTELENSPESGSERYRKLVENLRDCLLE